MVKENITYYCKKACSLTGKKVSEYEVYGAESTHNEAEIFNGNIESLSFSGEKGIGIRVFKKGKTGYAYTSNLEENEIIACIDKAVENADISTCDIYNYLPSPKDYLYSGDTVNRKTLFSDNFESFTIEQKIELAKKLESCAKSIDKRVSAVSDLIYDDVCSDTVIMNSNGFDDSYKSTSAFIYIGIISRDNSDTSTGDYFGYERDLSFFKIEEIAEMAVKRSTSLLGAKKIKSGKMDLLLHPFVSAQLLQVLAGILAADSVQKGKSIFKGHLGKKIFALDINIIDDGTLEKGLSSKPFDAEGVPKGRTVVFENGILQTYLYNTYTARKDSRLSTGNSVRASYKSPPQTGISNFYLEAGKTTVDDMIAKTDKGFYVTDIIGVHSGINPISGQISVGAKGLLIEKGSLTVPVKEVTIATDIFSFCKSITDTGNDLKFFPSGGYAGSPSLLVEDITVSGN
ncbi:MAG: TldD/PmbA family protein [Actinobacteria bacterium]|nr:TldD/PmbA family protein [Actinomycetota bacterium]